MVCDAVILAAGHGKRMHSTTPKALHRLGGTPLIAWAEQVCRQATGRPSTVVIGPEAPEAREALPDDVVFVEQTERRGTGHAISQVAPALRGRTERLLIVTVDMPLLRAETLVRLAAAQEAAQVPLAMLTLQSERVRGFGRVLRDGQGQVQEIVEEAVASPEALAVRELNASVYCVAADWLWEHLPRLEESPSGEIYLTDLVGMAAQEGTPAATVAIDDADEVIGINTREHLAEAEAALRRRINRSWMLAGVTMIDPETTYIEPSVILEADVILFPNTHLHGATSVGRGTRLGPHTIVRDSVIGEACVVEASVIEGAFLDDEVHVGPFGHLRPGARLGRRVHMGNFGEVKNSVLGEGVKMGHFSYVGDAEIGAETNIGAGTITCNYARDGSKNRTEVGRRVFIGSDTLLVAPLRVGDDAATGAGSVVTRDVPDGYLAVGMPARSVRDLRDDG